MGLLDQIKTMADLPPGPITLRGLLGKRKESLMDYNQNPITIEKFQTGKEEYLKKQDLNYYTRTTTKDQIDKFRNWYKPGSKRADGNGYNSLESLEPNFRNTLENFIKAVYDRTGYMMKIGTVHKDRVTRSPEAQDALFERGEQFTKAKSFESAHNYGLGADFSIFHPSDKKKVLWDDDKFREIGGIADEYGLQNLIGERDGYHDPGHFMPKGWGKPEDADAKRQQYYDQKQGGFNTRRESQ